MEKSSANKSKIHFILIALVLIPNSARCLEAGSACVTPNKERGYCISLFECESILDSIANRTESSLKFAKQSHCGCDENEPLVCCGTQSDFILIQNENENEYEENPTSDITTLRPSVTTTSSSSLSTLSSSEIVEKNCTKTKNCGCTRKNGCLDAGDLCKTPNGEMANCISLYECDAILDAIVIRTETSLNFSKQSHCGCDDTEPLVCCGNYSTFIDLSSTTMTMTMKTSEEVDEEEEEEVVPILEITTRRPMRTTQRTDKETTITTTTISLPITTTTEVPTTASTTTKRVLTQTSTHQIVPSTTTEKVAVTFMSNLLPAANKCGMRKVSKSALKKLTVYDEYPWLAVIYSDMSNRPVCFGSLINRRYILTSGSCLMENPNSPRKITKVRLGEYDVSKNGVDCAHDLDFDECSEPPIDYRVDSVIVHEDFNQEISYENDVGLIRLMTNVRITDYTRPICLLPIKQEAMTDDILTAAGWGYIQKQGQLARIKKKASLRVISDEECHSVLDNSEMSEDAFFVPKSAMCLRYINRTQCLGDTGVPLMSEKDGQFYQQGLVSFAKDDGYCDEEETVMLATKISDYIEWIINKLKP